MDDKLTTPCKKCSQKKIPIMCDICQITFCQYCIFVCTECGLTKCVDCDLNEHRCSDVCADCYELIDGIFVGESGYLEQSMMFYRSNYYLPNDIADIVVEYITGINYGEI